MLLFVGGIRSGKSSLAQRWAETQAPRRLFMANCVPHDAEMSDRIYKHKSTRDVTWGCLEEGLDPQQALETYFSSHDIDRPGVVLFDCVSMWLANMQQAGVSPEDGLLRVHSFLSYLAGLRLPVGLVSMETGLGLVASSPVGRRFQDMLGIVNQELARLCPTVIFVSCGLPMLLKGNLPSLSC